MADIIQLRRDAAANWASANPILAQGEVGVDLDVDQVKIGDGSTAWNALPYALQSPAISWARCKGDTPISILASSGPNAPTSFVRNSTGVYTFTRPAAATADYAWWAFGTNYPGQGAWLAKSPSFTQSTTEFRLVTYSSGGTSQDQTEFMIFVL